MNSGNYTQATHLAANHLSKHSKSENAKQVIATAYPLAKSQWLEKAEAAERATHPFHWENAVVAYGSLNEMADSIESSEGANRLNLAVVRFPDEYETSKENASMDREIAGDELMEFGERYHARTAYDHYERALGFKPESANLASKLRDALHLGTIRVALSPDLGRPFGVDFYKLMEDIHRELDGRRLGKFVKLVPFDVVDYEGHFEEPHHIINISVHAWEIGREREYFTRKAFKRSVEVGKTKDDPPKPIMKEVKATVNTFEYTKNSRGTLHVTVYDLDLVTVVYSGPIFESVSWADHQSVVSGDRRALKDGKPRFSEKRPSPPSDYRQESRLIERLASELRRELMRFYVSF
ncbi:hypothetical protein MLD52_04420 [Puniceicoccaceae bacterium K14]|nr:hypothetical protein [Puniceicoccaceae bacterium K14]